MHQVAGVGVGQPFGRLTEVVGRAIELQRPAHFDNPLQILTVDIFHDNEIAVHFIVDAVGLDDVGMVQRGDCPGLGEETVERRTVLGNRARYDFQGHAAVHRHVFGEEDGAHAALAEALDELVFAQAELCPRAKSQECAGLPAADEVFTGERSGESSGIGGRAG